MLLDSEYAPGGVVVYYADGGEEIIHVNKYVIDLFECDGVDDFLDLVQGSFRTFVHGEDIDSAEDSIWGQIENLDGLDHINYRIQTKTGKLVNVEDFGRLVDNAGPRPVFHVFIIEAVGKNVVDWLTGLPCMERFHDLATMGAQTMWRRGEVPVAISLDLVGMKSFNAQYSRAEGDTLLRVFADVLRKHFGSEACSRFAEDHYYAFAPMGSVDERVNAFFEDFKAATEGKTLPVRAGAYRCEPDEDIVAVGFDRAKIACDMDRKTWESHLLWFDDEMRAKERLRLHVLDHVDQAIDEGWIRPYYQLVVRSATGDACGEEALARWSDPKYGELSPAQFVPVLEEAGMLQKLDMHMVDCVLADMEAKRENDVDVVPVSVNISLRDLGKLDLVDELVKRVDARGVSRSLLRVEFTESAASDDPTLLREQVTALHAAGFEVWLDDFGSGYSSLNTLQDFNFDLIKLDMRFISNVQSPRARQIVAGVIRSAKQLGVGTLAEGVETEEQAMYLEQVGCDILQGYFFAKPNPLEDVMGRSKAGIGIPREDPDELAYWDAVGEIDLIEPIRSIDGPAVDGLHSSELPAGIMEVRDGVWSLLRGNEACREFLLVGDAAAKRSETLVAQPLMRDVDKEFKDAAKRSMESGSWERVAGRKEYGTGLQFYTRMVASTSDARAFLLASMPTMLGTALGAYGDVPIAYAVFRVICDETESSAVDAEYIFASAVYCEWADSDREMLINRSFLEVNPDESSRVWLDRFYRAAVLDETVRDIVYIEEIGHWINFTMAPSPAEGCCVFAFTIADDEHRERERMIVGRDTSDLIIEIANVASGEQEFSAAMNGVLKKLSEIIKPKRLLIYDRGDGYEGISFEWRAEGVKSQMGFIRSEIRQTNAIWDQLSEGGNVIRIPDISKLDGLISSLYDRLAEHGVERVLAAPLLDGDSVLGYLVAEDYSLEDGVEVDRLLESVAMFISARIVNYRLVSELERTGTHDALTGLLNRRGFDWAIGERITDDSDEPYALALIDIDDFKKVNDLYGHDVGDEVLRTLAHELKAAVPVTGVIGRNGGDELAVVLFGDDAEDADRIFQGFSHVELKCEYDGKRYRFSVSIGYAGYPGQASSLKEAYSMADAALYAVKLAGKAGCKRYDVDLTSQHRSQLGFTSRDIAENVPGAILVHRAGDDGEILFANDALIELFECDDLDDFMAFTGGTFAGLVHPDDDKRVYEELVRQVSLDDIGAKNFSNYRIITKSGAVKHVAHNGRLVEIEDIGKVFYVLIVDRDERDV